MDAEDILRVMEYAITLKETPRAGWLVKGIADAESVADHSCATALLAFMLAQDELLDAHKAATMAIVHDLAESVTGDVITASASGIDKEAQRAKHAREREIFGQMLSGNDALKGLALEYMEQRSPESRIVKDADLLELAMQALRYERQGRAEAGALDEFWNGARERVHSVVARRLLEELENSRKA